MSNYTHTVTKTGRVYYYRLSDDGKKTRIGEKDVPKSAIVKSAKKAKSRAVAAKKSPAFDLDTLNFLGALYHSYFGLHPEKHGGIEIEDTKEETLESLRKNKKKYGWNMYNNDGTRVIDVSDTWDTTVLPYSRAIKLAATTVPFATVTLKFREKDYWPRAWYNEPSKWWKDYTPHLKPYVLPYLNTRKYIHVDNKAKKVVVSAEKKGSPLTLDDILFATRALMHDDTRVVNDGYTILKQTTDEITLEPHIDNWST